MFYSQVILAKKGPLAKVWLAAHWGDKKLARPQIFATDIAQSVDTIVNPTMPLALRMSGHLLLGVVRIYSRKVKYVLSDCTEAMLKLQMAFATAQTKGKELLEMTGGGVAGSTNNNNNAGNSNNNHNTTSHVVNFGDYEQIHVVEGFCLPMPDNSEWIVADDDDDDEEEHDTVNPNNNKDGSSRLAASQSSPPEARYQPPTEETWVPFDPENEDDDDDEEEDRPEFHSRVSDVELARAAGDSFLSGDETRRGSSILEKSPAALQERPEHGPPDEEEPMDFAYVPFQEDDEEEEDHHQQQQQSDPTNDDSLLRLSTTSNTPDVSGLSSPGLDDSHDVDARSSSLKRGPLDAVDGTSPSKRKRRKRRKVIVDNDHTELTNEHIKAMLADTSDIVKRMRHPADVQDDNDDEKNDSTFVPILTQPFLADDGHLHPELLQLWQNNFYRALDRPCPFETRETVEDVEQARQAPATTEDDDDEEASKASDLERTAAPIPTLPEEEEEEPDDFAPPPMDDDEEEEEEDPINPTMDSESEQDVGTNLLLRGSIGDLGLVNELELADEEDEEEREAVGEHVGTKWHQHTVKVLKLLQSRIRADNDDDDETEDRATLPISLEFGDLAKNVNRRTAASCFIECLQLKTWDFVELAQDDEYGPITISAGPRFLEQPPNEA